MWPDIFDVHATVMSGEHTLGELCPLISASVNTPLWTLRAAAVLVNSAIDQS